MSVNFMYVTQFFTICSCINIANTNKPINRLSLKNAYTAAIDMWTGPDRLIDHVECKEIAQHF